MNFYLFKYIQYLTMLLNPIHNYPIYIINCIHSTYYTQWELWLRIQESLILNYYSPLDLHSYNSLLCIMHTYWSGTKHHLYMKICWHFIETCLILSRWYFYRYLSILGRPPKQLVLHHVGSGCCGNVYENRTSWVKGERDS